MKNTRIYMKTLKLLSVIVFITMIMSCKDFLDLKPISSTTMATFYDSQEDFNQAVVGTYAELKEVYTFGYYLLLGDLRADNTSMQVLGSGGESNKKEIDSFDLDPTNKNLNNIWGESYQALQRANGVLTNIDRIEFDQTLKNQYMGESQAVRALIYFNLVRIFGDVPLVTSSEADITESYDTPRSPVAEIYNLIVSDLTSAISKLPDSYSDSESGRVTKGAAQTLLGQVYLTQKNFSEAATQFGDVIGSGEYDLLMNYEDNFEGTNQGNSESVWQLLFKNGEGGMGSSYPNWHAPQGSGGILIQNGSAFAFNQVTKDIYEAYEDGDLRRDVSIGLGFTDEDGVWQPGRYVKLYVDQDAGEGNNESEADWNVFRYSHVLLMAAEALNETNGGPTANAYTYINAVRTRAGLTDLSGLDQSTFRTAVYHEQRVEVAFEGHRWFDLLRTGRAISVINSKIGGGDPDAAIGPSSPISEFQLLYPIPESVIDTSNPGVISQNPGY